MLAHSHCPASPLGDRIHGCDVLGQHACIRCPAAFPVIQIRNITFYLFVLNHFLTKCCPTALSSLRLVYSRAKSFFCSLAKFRQYKYFSFFSLISFWSSYFSIHNQPWKHMSVGIYAMLWSQIKLESSQPIMFESRISKILSRSQILPKWRTFQYFKNNNNRSINNWVWEMRNSWFLLLLGVT